MPKNALIDIEQVKFYNDDSVAKVIQILLLQTNLVLQCFDLTNTTNFSRHFNLIQQ